MCRRGRGTEVGKEGQAGWRGGLTEEGKRWARQAGGGTWHRRALGCFAACTSDVQRRGLPGVGYCWKRGSKGALPM